MAGRYRVSTSLAAAVARFTCMIVARVRSVIPSSTVSFVLFFSLFPPCHNAEQRLYWLLCSINLLCRKCKMGLTHPPRDLTPCRANPLAMSNPLLLACRELRNTLCWRFYFYEENALLSPLAEQLSSPPASRSSLLRLHCTPTTTLYPISHRNRRVR